MRPNEAVDRHPRHHPRISVVPGLLARLPNAGARLVPHIRQVLHQRFTHEVGLFRPRQPRLIREVQGVQHLAPDIDLQLGGRRIANPDGKSVAIAGEA